MNPVVGWILAVLALIVGWQQYGWKGIVFAITVIVFWMVLMFNRTIRVMKNASGRPIGTTGNATALGGRLKVGMPLVQVIATSGSLGRRDDPDADVYSWTDPQGVEITVTLADGRVSKWAFHYPE